ncbi:hypothetical protein [Catenulispora pinisilvae]|uniref:hypothetical protein n=1 Tax=Catenulispora pinisilvae TaxID=2705253 RepID=UPI001891FEF7|nr:hypothetical protein [Catenulispora pinisilvae]
MEQITLRPPRSKPYLLLVFAVLIDLLYLAFPFWIAAIHMGVLITVIFALASAAMIVGTTFLGWLGLNMRVEVEPDAVRIYYFRLMPVIIARGTITDVKTVKVGNSYAPGLHVDDGRTLNMRPLAKPTPAQAAAEVVRLKQALQDVAPFDLSTQ